MDDERFTKTLANLPGAQDAVPERLAMRADAVVRRAVDRRQRQGVQRISAVVAVGAASYGIFSVVARAGAAETVRRALDAAALEPIVALTERTLDAKGRTVAVVHRVCDFRGTPRVWEERRDADGRVIAVTVWRDGKRWSSVARGATPTVATGDAPDFRAGFFAAPLERVLKGPLASQMREVDQETVGRERVRVFVVPTGPSRQLRLLFHAKTLALVQLEERDILGTGSVLRRRIDVAYRIAVADIDGLFSPLPGAVSPETLLARVRASLTVPGAGLTFAPPVRNRHGDLFVLYRGMSGKTASVEAVGALEPVWFDLQSAGDVQGRWFPAPAGAVAVPTVTLRYNGRAVTLKPRDIDGEVPYYASLCDVNFRTPLAYLRPIHRARDARLRRDAVALKAAADEALANWQALESPYDGWLHRYGLADRTWAARCLGDRLTSRAADKALAQLVTDPEEYRPLRNRASSWEAR